MKKVNPTIGELQVFGGIISWIGGSVLIIYEFVKSIIENNLINRWKFLLAFSVFVGALGALLYFVGKYRIKQGQKEDKEKEENK